ncbi:FAD-dependent oxidoreductase [Bdellovibrio sp. HCB337]|uniref:FAD-dependent oxidoreductase n=1 Tax=Bdellovibrio sp. HCB337 TaxID=3394358 RepID=UPI0039A6B1A9
MAQKRSQNHVYDYAIIGSGLSGLSIAAALSRFTDNIALLESGDVPGGMNRAIKFPTGIMNNGLRYVPDTESAHKALEFLENILGLKIIGESVEAPPITFASGTFKPFVGFGDNPPPFYEELNYFTANKSLNLKLEPYAWTQLLFEKFKGEFMPRSYVTKFNSLNEQVTQVTINGAKTLAAHNFIFCGSVKDLALLLPEDALAPRARQKLSKNVYWTALCLDVCHSHEVTETPSMHVLNGTTDDEIGPCAGRFMPAITEGEQKLQASQWMTFIEEEVTEDSEVVAASLKKIKRQIKRAYPEALESIKLERIIVAPQIAGNGELKLSGNQSLPGLQNLWIGSTSVNAQKNIVGALSQAQMVIAALGFEITAPEFVSETETTEIEPSL